MSLDVIVYHIIPFLSCRDTNMRLVSKKISHEFDIQKPPDHVDMETIQEIVFSNKYIIADFLYKHDITVSLSI